MNHNNIFDLINKKSSHLKWAKDRTVLLVRHGSHAYGTNTETSDEDFKGILIAPKPYYLGVTHRIEQIELKNPDPDCVIYEIGKFFNLAMDSNPNIIEVLHTDPSDHFIVDEIGEMILDRKYDFLSKKAKHTFLGYSVSQLKRIKSHKKWLMNPPKAPPTREEMGLSEEILIPAAQVMAVQAEIQKELDRAQFDFMDHLEESVKIGIRTVMSEMLTELKITSEDHWQAAARKIGLSDNFIEIMKKEREYNSRHKEWKNYLVWQNDRNPARAALEAKYGYDCKHAYHLVRLIRMCREILTTGKVIVKRPDREELLAIRNGEWSYDKLIDFAETQEKELNEIYATCNVIQHHPDRESLDKFCVELIEKSISNYSIYSLKKKLFSFLGQ